MKSNDTGDIVRYTGDLTEPLSAEILAEIAALEGRPIDFSDIPPQEVGNNWYSPGALVPGENKRQITLRLDSDVLAFFKSTGNRYQTRINSVLREYMKAHLRQP